MWGWRPRILELGPLVAAGRNLFHRFNDVSAVGTAPNFPNFPSGYSWTGFDVHEIRAAVSYKF
jgi:hypothetical protein